ncbi:hypothetical protein Tco_0010553 [Tanacetum coccineum]
MNERRGWRQQENEEKNIEKNLKLFESFEEEYEEDPELEEEDEDNEYESFDYDDLHLAYSGEKSPKYGFAAALAVLIIEASQSKQHDNSESMRLGSLRVLGMIVKPENDVLKESKDTH